MKNNGNNNRELVLEVVKDGFRRLIYRTRTNDGSILFLEESDLEDLSRPVSENSDFNVFFTERSFWKSFTEFTSAEGFLNRDVWHRPANEWLTLKPTFIHPDLAQLIKRSLAEATREVSSDIRQAEGIRTWLRKLSQPTTDLDNAIFNPAKKFRHAV